MNILLLLIPTQLIFSSSAQTRWSYKSQDAWPHSCKGVKQSPIDVSSADTICAEFEDLSFNSVTFQHLDAILLNTGHSVEIRYLNNTSHPAIAGGDLDGEYILDAFHFHWPAEHTVDKYRFPLEGHFVYYSTKYRDLKDALKYPRGVAVFGVFYDIIPSSARTTTFNFVREVPEVAHKVNRSVFVKITLKDYLPRNYNEFYRYDGSLTTPDCNEGVIWTLFKDIQPIPDEKFNNLINIFDAKNEPLESNFRQLQELNERYVLETC